MSRIRSIEAVLEQFLLTRGRGRGRTPALLHKEMERLFAVRQEVEDILYLRMRRTAPSSESADDTREQAAIVSHVMPGPLRFTVDQWGPGSVAPGAAPADLDLVTHRLAAGADEAG